MCATTPTCDPATRPDQTQEGRRARARVRSKQETHFSQGGASTKFKCGELTQAHVAQRILQNKNTCSGVRVIHMCKIKVCAECM